MYKDIQVEEILYTKVVCKSFQIISWYLSIRCYIIMKYITIENFPRQIKVYSQSKYKELTTWFDFLYYF